MAFPVEQMGTSRRALLRAGASASLLGGALIAGCGREVEPLPAPTAAPPPTASSSQPAGSATATTGAPAAYAPASPVAATIRATADRARPVAPAPGLARVALVKTRDRAMGVQQAVALLGVNPARGNAVVLKPNFNSADPAPGSTHPDVLRALVGALWAMDATAITIVDRSGMGNTRATMERLGVPALARELGVGTVVLDDAPADAWVMIQPPASHWQRGFPFARVAHEAAVVVQACCLKTHRFGGQVTLSLKNAVGLVGKRVPGDVHDYMTELHGSPHQRQMIAEINVAYTPALIVLDGVEAFVSGGPDTGQRVWSEVVLAGTDRIAIDAVGVALLRLHGTTPEVSRGPIFGQDQIARAVGLGLGISGPDQIEIVTGDAASAAYADQVRATLAAG